VEGSGRGLIQGTIPEFVWRDWGKSRKTQSGLASLRSRFEPGTSRIRSWSANHSTTTFGGHLKGNLATITYYGIKMKSGSPPSNALSQPPPWNSSQGQPSCYAAAHASCAKAVQVRTWCIYERNACSFSSITSHRLVTLFWNTWSVCLWQVLIERQNSWNYGRTDFKQCISCNNGIRLQGLNTAIDFVVSCVKGFMCSS
jgi:hypothetical protein